MKQYISETIGTFAMVFCGCGAMTVNEITNGSISHVGVAITWGLIVMTMIYAFGEISGAHFNPAVTIGFAYAKKIRVEKSAQIHFSAGHWSCFCSIFVVVFISRKSVFRRNDPSRWFPAIQSSHFRIFTHILFNGFVIINVSTGSKEIGTMAAVAVGGAILLEAMFAGPITKASMNPIRSIPALFTGNFKYLWLYIVAPILGAIVAVSSCKLVKEEQCC